MASAFQSTAFQNSAFQIDAVPVPIVVMDMHDGKAPERTRDYIRKERERREDLRAKLRRASDDVNGIRREVPPEPIAPIAPPPVVIPQFALRPIPNTGLQDQLAALRAQLAALHQQEAAEYELAMEEDAIEILLLAA